MIIQVRFAVKVKLCLLFFVLFSISICLDLGKLVLMKQTARSKAKLL